MAMMKGIWVLEKHGKFTTKTTKKTQRSQRFFHLFLFVCLVSSS